MRVLHVCASDAQGGAAIGAHRLHRAMLDNGVDSRMLVLKKLTDDDSVTQPLSERRVELINFKKKLTIVALQMLELNRNPALKSVNVIPSGLGKIINSADVDIVQLHWICNSTLSIGEIAEINKPIVWKQPDMWAFSGAEHYIIPSEIPRYRDGYTGRNRQEWERGVDVNRWLWQYKRWRWRNKEMTIVTPSTWLQQCAKESVLFQRYKVHHILNPIDLQRYKPYPKAEVRDLFGLPKDKKLMMFGALSSTYDVRKGYHYLREALDKFSQQYDTTNIEIVIFGADEVDESETGAFKIHCMGTIHDQQRLAKLYSAADVMVLPSLQDNLPNVMKEAMACGVPCVSFAVGGMMDMVEHRKTGYLARPYDIDDLASGMAWILENGDEKLSMEVRRQARIRHDPVSRVKDYLDVYEDLLQREAVQ